MAPRELMAAQTSPFLVRFSRLPQSPEHHMLDNDALYPTLAFTKVCSTELESQGEISYPHSINKCNSTESTGISCSNNPSRPDSIEGQVELIVPDPIINPPLPSVTYPGGK